MSSTTQVTTFLDLYTDLMNRLRADTTATATITQAKRYINTALYDMVLGFTYKMPWLERDAYIRTHAPYTTGTVDWTQGGSTLTGHSTLWNTANAYSENNARTTGKVILASGFNIYRVTTVTSDTSITLRDPVIDATASGSSYTYFEDEYTLATDFLRPIDYRQFSDALKLPLIGRNEFRARFPRSNWAGPPRTATILDFAPSGSTTPVRRVQFYPYPDQTYLVPYTYITNQIASSTTGVGATSLSNDTDEPNIPIGYRHAIIFHALYHWYRDKRDDARSQEAKGEYTDIMLRVAGDVEIGSANKATLAHSSSMYAGHAVRPYSRRSGNRISVNNAFDRFEE